MSTMVDSGTTLTRERVLAALDDVKDPEIPVVSVVELGIIQAIAIDGCRVTVAITPTFSGCPALDLMRQEIRERVLALGATQVDVPVVLDPPWSTDRVDPAAWRRMQAIGLAPPPPPVARYRADESLSLQLAAPTLAVACPFCGSSDTVLENAFGPTICRALHYCNSCQQPFEEFKAL